MIKYTKGGGFNVDPTFGKTKFRNFIPLVKTEHNSFVTDTYIISEKDHEKEDRKKKMKASLLCCMCVYEESKHFHFLIVITHGTSNWVVTLNVACTAI